MRREDLPPRPESLSLRDTAASEAAAGGWIALGEIPGRELALGLVGKFWRPVIAYAEVAPEDFREFDEPGWGKIAARPRTGTPMDEFMQAAIAEAEQGRAEGGIPIGSVLVHRGRILGRGHNRRVQQGSCVLHGEMDALENAGRLPASAYRDSVIYTTLSPCSMCSGAILLYGIKHVIVGESRNFMGEEELLRSRGVRVDVLQDERCIELMRKFIEDNPRLWNEDIGE